MDESETITASQGNNLLSGEIKNISNTMDCHEFMLDVDWLFRHFIISTVNKDFTSLPLFHLKDDVEQRKRHLSITGRPLSFNTITGFTLIIQLDLVLDRYLRNL